MQGVAEVLDGMSKLIVIVETGAFEGFAGQNTEPDFELIEL